MRSLKRQRLTPPSCQVISQSLQGAIDSQGPLFKLAPELWELLCRMDDETLGIYNTLLRLCKTMYNTLSRKSVCRRIKNAFERAYFSQKTIRLEQNLVHEGILVMIRNILRRTSALIAGSYPLQYLANATFKDYDIDIFIPYIETMEERTRYQQGEHNGPVGVFMESLYKEHFEKLHDEGQLQDLSSVIGPSYTPGEDVRGIMQLSTLKKTRIQCILVGLLEGERLDDALFGIFDFSFCKCWYDGETLTSRNVYDQIRKAGTESKPVKLDGTPIKGPQLARWKAKRDFRKKKYTERGFLFLE
jgi:hypothetical protein